MKEYRGGGRKVRIKEYSDPTRGPHGQSTVQNIRYWSNRASANSTPHSIARDDPHKGKPQPNLDLPTLRSNGGAPKLHSTSARPRTKPEVDARMVDGPRRGFMPGVKRI